MSAELLKDIKASLAEFEDIGATDVPNYALLNRCHAVLDAHNTRYVSGYEKLRDVLERAYGQASAGKGAERHGGNGVAFEDQPMQTISEMLGSVDGILYQAIKKTRESKRLGHAACVRELLGAINYLAGGIIFLEARRAEGDAHKTVGELDTDALGSLVAFGTTKAKPDDVVTFKCNAPDKGGWIGWLGGECPVAANTRIEISTRDGQAQLVTAPQELRWSHSEDDPTVLHPNRDIFAYRFIG